MKFYGRQDELAELSKIRDLSREAARFTVVTGRRRVGKTELIDRAFNDGRMPYIYLLVTRRSEKDLCGIFQEEVKRTVPINLYGAPERFGQLFESIMEYSVHEPLTLVIDEFQEFDIIDPAIFGDIQGAWDRYHKTAKINLVVCGSVSTWIEENILNNTGFVGRASLNLDVGELPLRHCVRFWGEKAARIAPREIFDLLSVTGGVPRYLEDVDPGLSAAENIRRLCFLPKAPLRDDFSKIFNSVFGEAAETKRTILEALSDGPLGVSELAEKLGTERSGYLSRHLEQLTVAGFVSEDAGLNPETGRPLRLTRFRLRDNYTRFYLKCIRPNGPVIDRGAFSFASLESLPGWETILGFQFENLVAANLAELLPLLGMGGVLLTSAAPYRQKAGARKTGCQIDLLLQAGRTACVVEIKRRRTIGREVEDEVAAKIAALRLPRGITVRAALVYDGELSPAVEAGGFFDALVPASKLLGF